MWKFKDLLKSVQKLFSGITDRASYIENEKIFERTPLEIMKLLEMHSYNNGALINHWSGKPLRILESAQDFYTFPELLSIFIAKSFDDLHKIIGSNEIEILKERYGTPDGLIDHIRHRMITEKSPVSLGEPKYLTMWFATHKPSVSNDDFRYTMKFLALISTGQIDMDLFPEFWDREFTSTVSRTKINYNYTRRLSPAEIRKVVIYALSGYSGIDYTSKLK